MTTPRYLGDTGSPGGRDVDTATREQFLHHNEGRNRLERRRDAFNNEMRYVRVVAPQFPAQRVLDLGCGPGTLSEFLVGHGASVTGIDFDLDLVKGARSRVAAAGPGGRFLVGRVERLPFLDGAFDTCVADSILEHVPNWQETLREVTRVLRPGGTLYFSTANRLHPFTPEIRHVPLFPWFPNGLKLRIMDWAVRTRPHLVNYTEYPAVSWFTYEQVRAFLEPLGYTVRTRLDLIDINRLAGWKRTVAAWLLPLRRVPLVRWMYYVYAADVSVYAVKHGGSASVA